MVPRIISPKLADKKSIEQRALIKRIDIYSAKNTITNKTELYSVLNPDTNSLSPSAKSNGDRLASASTLTLKIKKAIIFHLTHLNCFALDIS